MPAFRSLSPFFLWKGGGGEGAVTLRLPPPPPQRFLSWIDFLPLSKYAHIPVGHKTGPVVLVSWRKPKRLSWNTRLFACSAEKLPRGNPDNLAPQASGTDLTPFLTARNLKSNIASKALINITIKTETKIQLPRNNPINFLCLDILQSAKVSLVYE